MTRPPGGGDAAGEAAATEDAPPGETPGAGERIAALEAEVAGLTERHARAAADLRNYRRRAEEGRAAFARATLADAIRRFLPLLDDLDRALAAVEADLADRPWVDGVRLVQRKFRETLAGAGVEEIAGEGAEFDPLVHESVAFGAGPQGQVIALARAGYRIGDYVVRPAQVVVGDGAEPGGAEPGGGAPGEAD